MIRVRYYSFMTQDIKVAYFTMDTFNLWKTDCYCIDIMDCETGEMLYIKGYKALFFNKEVKKVYIYFFQKSVDKSTGL